MKGGGRIYKRKDVWWVDYSFRGKRFRESTGSTRRKDAVDLLRHRQGEMGNGKLVGQREEKVTFEQLVGLLEDDYEFNRKKSTRRMRSAVKQLRHHFGGYRAVDLRPTRVRTYILDRQGEGAADATIQKETAALKRMLNLAVECEMLTRSPKIPTPQVRNVRTDFLDGGDLEAVINELPAHLRPIVRLASITGWRKAEILNLRWNQVDRDTGIVRLRPGTTKNDDGREAPYHVLPELVEVIETQWSQTERLERDHSRIVTHVFHYADGRPIKDMRGAWDSACERAGVPGAWFHDLRRTAVRNLERAGVARSVAMSITGHKTESVYRRYAIVDSAVQREQLQKLADWQRERRVVRSRLLFSAPPSGTVAAQSA